MTEKQRFPWVSINGSQAEGRYEVSVQVSEGVFTSYYIDAHNLKWLEKDIQLIKRMYELKHSTNRDKKIGEQK
jgi:hypothetical protein